MSIHYQGKCPQALQEASRESGTYLHNFIELIESVLNFNLL
ncbi:Hypothetical protein PAU_02480 [Photorhabdus asymbiotica]|uniref:Uncharacterized protein n=1 Tax=Photorhabdus asymbiotica subsp. asymbiotica (strain ATCC 43949 / 3105-77) TaxID=553480 RepID=B6VNE3_PHOAA|nr:Hypothetical protein PAU_02480 [Photorhabdus asymbiotica]CAR67673.1 Hypothetical protein PA-RVA19-1802 [Photorhabdus asymbiotica subsp. asymbiotica ATCC 43949]